MLNPENIIAAFTSSSNSEPEASLVPQLDNIDPRLLFKSGDYLNQIHSAGIFIPYVTAIITGSRIPSESAIKRRGLCFETSIDALCTGIVPAPHNRELVELLNRSAHLLNADQALVLVDRILDSVSHLNSVTETVTQLFDLLPQLVARSSAVREYTVEKILGMSWPHNQTVVFAATAAELCSTEAECERAIGTIMSHLNRYLFPRPESGSTTSSNFWLDSDDVPLLVYHIASFSKKCDAKSANSTLKQSVLAVITEILDALVGETHQDSIDSGTSTRVSEVSYRRRMRQIQPAVATIAHHMSVLVTKDQVCNVI